MKKALHSVTVSLLFYFRSLEYPKPSAISGSGGSDAHHPLGVADCCTDKGGGGGPSPGSRLDKARRPRPWAGTTVDFEARLKYSQSYHRHPLIWAEPPWGPHSWRGTLVVTRPTEREKESDFFHLFFSQGLTHPLSWIFKISKTPRGFSFFDFSVFFLVHITWKETENGSPACQGWSSSRGESRRRPCQRQSQRPGEWRRPDVVSISGQPHGTQRPLAAWWVSRRRWLLRAGLLLFHYRYCCVELERFHYSLFIYLFFLKINEFTGLVWGRDCGRGAVEWPRSSPSSAHQTCLLLIPSVAPAGRNSAARLNKSMRILLEVSVWVDFSVMSCSQSATERRRKQKMLGERRKGCKCALLGGARCGAADKARTGPNPPRWSRFSTARLGSSACVELNSLTCEW